MPVARYAMDPTASRYGTSAIAVASDSVIGAMVGVNRLPGSKGVATGLHKLIPNLSRTHSAYTRWLRVMVPLSRSQVTAIPNIKCRSSSLRV
jgi:hypothetical protein